MVVPSLALAPLWGLSTYQLLTQWQTENAQSDLSAAVGRPSGNLFLSLEQERRLTAEEQADPGTANRSKLVAQRVVTDKALTLVRPLADQDTSHGQQGLAAAITGAERSLDQLAAQRQTVDTGSAGQQKAFDYYSSTLASLLSIFTSLSHSSNSDVAALAQTQVDIFSSIDTIDHEDALLGRNWKLGHLTVDDYHQFIDAFGAQEYLLQQRVAPRLTGAESASYKALTASKSWTTKQSLEEQVITAGPHHSNGELVLGQIHAEWRSSVDAVTPQLLQLAILRVGHINKVASSSANDVLTTLLIVSAVGLLAVILVILTSWRLTVTLRRRILDLRGDAQRLQERLPDVVARLERGEDVDVDKEIRLVEPTPDELGELGRALNLASRSAVLTAVRQAEQHRGFERLLQRIARRTQILIGLQLRKLDELERKHEDPEVLDGLFDLDHLTARLRRYEENLVILGGGQPQRRWRKPVRLLDVLRAAQGEVQDYRRISIEVDDEPWVTERAVGPLVHILAELMENAAAFSRPPTPVEVRAARVSRGVAVEIEDRGLGMEPAQYAAANALMLAPPQLDVMTHADDVRLGLYVVARLSVGLGLQVELRPSAFGGTRVIVLLPAPLVVGRPSAVAMPAALPEEAAAYPAGPQPHPQDSTAVLPPYAQPPREDGQLPARARGHAMAQVTAPLAGPPDGGDVPASSGAGPLSQPLPQRVRQASLAAELKVPVDEDGPGDEETWAVRDQPGRSGATIGAFQRQSRRARWGDGRNGGLPEPSTPRTDERE